MRLRYVIGSALLQRFLVSLALPVASFSYAAENPWYVELGYGVSDIDSPYEIRSGFSRQNLVPLFTVFPGYIPITRLISDFEREQTLSLSVGYKFSERWGVELAYQGFGSFGSSEVLDAGGNAYSSIQENQQDIKGFMLMAYDELAINNKWSIRGKVGVYAMDSDATGSTPLLDIIVGAPGTLISSNSGPFKILPPILFNPYLTPPTMTYVYTSEALSSSPRGNFHSRKKEQGISFSIGAAYKINNRYSVHLDYQQINDVADSDIEVLKLGLAYKF